MTDRYQAGYKAALAEVAAQLRVDAASRANFASESILLRLADSIAGWTPDPDPEPLTRERARAWLAEERARINRTRNRDKTDTDHARQRLLCLSRDPDDSGLDDDGMRALAALLVDAAAGRVR